jgi:hypothetical protein
VTATRGDPKVVDCARPFLASLRAPGTARVALDRTLRLERRPVAGLRKMRGAEGDICHFGEHWTNGDPTVELPEDVPCRRGLRCCSGGAAGSDGVCTRAKICPPLP